MTRLKSWAVRLEFTHLTGTDLLLQTAEIFTNGQGIPPNTYSKTAQNLLELTGNFNCGIRGWGRAFRAMGPWSAEFIGIWPPYVSHFCEIREHLAITVWRTVLSMTEQQTLDDETSSTVLAEVERTLNDRLLIALPSNDITHFALTPSELLALRSTSGFVDIVNLCEIYLRGWKHSNCLTMIFW